MKDQILKETPIGENNLGVLVANSQTYKQPTKIRGITTSQINQALKADHPYPARVFLKADNQKEDIPVFFRIKENNSWIRPKIKTGSYLEVQGTYNNPLKSSRPSFTAYSYQILANYER